MLGCLVSPASELSKNLRRKTIAGTEKSSGPKDYDSNDGLLTYSDNFGV